MRIRRDREVIEQLYDPRKMSVKAQIAFISKQLQKKGISPDLVDLQALVDPELNYRENYANIMQQIGQAGSRSTHQDIIDNPACSQAKELKASIKAEEAKTQIPGMKAELKDLKTQCNCSTCHQQGLYDPAARKISRPPRNWFYAMIEGIKKSSDVRDPAAIVASIWRRLPTSKRAQIKAREEKGEHFKYDLPLPEDHPTRGIGTVRIVKPFKLAEVQVNVPGKAYDQIRRSGMFQRMHRQDGTWALVKRCKSALGNCNIFVDVMRR